jgi:hypothetical protein
MPPRYAYWTIIVDNQPTAFRAGLQEDLMPTYKRLKEKHPSATMMWFQNGKLWPTRVDAQEAMRARGEMGRRGDERQEGFRDRDRAPAAPGGERRDPRERPEWTPKRAATPSRRPAAGSGKLEWKPKGEFTPPPPRSERPEWKPKSTGPQARRPARPEWKSKPGGPRADKPSRTGRPEWKPRGKVSGVFSPTAGERKSRGERLEWKPKGSPSAVRTPDSGSREKRKWIPKEEYKKSKGAAAPRDSKWRPGGEHRDPRQKYKDAKKAKWTRFKKTIRTRWESKTNKKRDD